MNLDGPKFRRLTGEEGDKGREKERGVENGYRHGDCYKRVAIGSAQSSSRG